MLEKVEIEGINFPRLYIAENLDDVRIARSNGLPYIRWRDGKEKLIRHLLRPTLEKMFSGIRWDLILGPKTKVRSIVHTCSGNKIDNEDESVAEIAEDYDAEQMIDAQYAYDGIVDSLDHGEKEAEAGVEFTRDVGIADSERDHGADNSSLGYDAFSEDRLRVEDYIGDLSSSVDIEALDRLGLLPRFVGDIKDVISHNYTSAMRWVEGYTKKLGEVLGNFDRQAELMNLIIIDCSASIPDGIAATMLTLANTLRSQCNAALIITSRRSGFYPVGAELPKPQTLRDYYGRGNEGAEFGAILDKYIAGRKWGHVISFGDDDTPIWYGMRYDLGKMVGTRVKMVHHFHTRYADTPTGYAKWVSDVDPTATVVYEPNDWCRIMKSDCIF